MKQLKKDKNTYYWDCPRCGTSHTEDVMKCEQWTRDGLCDCWCDGTMLEKRLLNDFINEK